MPEDGIEIAACATAREFTTVRVELGHLGPPKAELMGAEEEAPA
jgi:hypothetical protein